MKKKRKLSSLDTTFYRLEFAFRMTLFFLVLGTFAGLGLLDAVLTMLWPARRSRENTPRWASFWLPRLVIKIFPSIMLVPCSWHRQHRVLQFRYPKRLRAGEFGWVELLIENVGSETWLGGTTHPFRIGVMSPFEGSAFCADAWINSTRPAELQAKEEIQPSMTTHFKIPIQAPSIPGTYREAWGPLIEGRNWLPALNSLNLQIEVTPES